MNGVGKGVARYPLHFNAPQVIFVMGEAHAVRGQSPLYRRQFLQKKLCTVVIPFVILFVYIFVNIYTPRFCLSFMVFTPRFCLLNSKVLLVYNQKLLTDIPRYYIILVM